MSCLYCIHRKPPRQTRHTHKKYVHAENEERRHGRSYTRAIEDGKLNDIEKKVTFTDEPLKGYKEQRVVGRHQVNTPQVSDKRGPQQVKTSQKVHKQHQPTH